MLLTQTSSGQHNKGDRQVFQQKGLVAGLFECLIIVRFLIGELFNGLLRKIKSTVLSTFCPLLATHTRIFL